MASTSTNKQPVFTDRKFSVIKDTSSAITGVNALPPGTAIDPQIVAGTLLLDCRDNDGAVVEYAYTVSREINFESYEEDPAVDDSQSLKKNGYVVNFYFCPEAAAFNPSKAFFLGAIEAALEEGDIRIWGGMPFVHAPVAVLGAESSGDAEPTYMRGLFVPKGQCLWACAVKQYLPNDEEGNPQEDPATLTPLVGVQGGYY